MTCLHSELSACLVNINFILSAMPYLFIQYINMLGRCMTFVHNHSDIQCKTIALIRQCTAYRPDYTVEYMQC
jgi:hypothetical protein